jgi:hypothetical protein
VDYKINFPLGGSRTVWGTASTVGYIFTNAAHQILARYTQTGTAGTFPSGTGSTGAAKCEVSLDFGATWLNLGTRDNNYYGPFANAYWAIGGIFNVAAGSVMHLTSAIVDGQ